MNIDQAKVRRESLRWYLILALYNARPEPVCEDVVQMTMRAIYPDRSVYENFNREGATMYEYASSVKENKRYSKQALSAAGDIEEIAQIITKILENNHVTAQKTKKTL